MTIETAWFCPRNPLHQIEYHLTLNWPRCTECGLGPAYHERPRWAKGVTLAVYVPASRSPLAARVAKGSGLVGLPHEDGGSVVYFEGWTRSQCPNRDLDKYGLWQAALENAAGRLVAAYPTSSLMYAEDEDVIQIGTMTFGGGIDIWDTEALTFWLS